MSVVIGTVLALQAIAGFNLGPDRIVRSPTLFPFLDYPMYGRARSEGDAVSRYVVVAIFADSSETRVRMEDLGLSFWHFRRGIVAALLARDRARLRDYASIYERRNGRRPTGFRLDDVPLIVTGAGLRDGEPTVVRRIPLGRED